MDPVVLIVLVAIVLAVIAVIAAEVHTGKIPDLIAAVRHLRRERKRKAGQR